MLWRVSRRLPYLVIVRVYAVFWAKSNKQRVGRLLHYHFALGFRDCVKGGEWVTLWRRPTRRRAGRRDEGNRMGTLIFALFREKSWSSAVLSTHQGIKRIVAQSSKLERELKAVRLLILLLT